jgi:polyisoprenoid-binding protein YceI
MSKTKYMLDARSSRFVVKVRAAGVLASFGHNPTIAFTRFTGWLEFDPSHPESGSFQMTVPADSLQVIDDISNKDRLEIERQMRDEVLEARKYPQIQFESREISSRKESDIFYQLQITGDLSLHGVTSQKQIEARLRLRDDEIRLSGGFRLLQSEFRIKPVTALAGALRVQDELTFEFEITGVKDES